MVRYSLSSLSY